MKPADVIRVSGWPATKGKRFTVHRVEADKVWAFDDSMRTRCFLVANCHIDREATKQARRVGAA